MSRRAVAVLGVGVGVALSPLLGIGCTLAADLLQRWNLRSTR